MPCFYPTAIPAGIGRRPCDLQVEAAGVSVAVNDLPGEIQPVTRLDSMVLGSISDTFTPPLVMIASDTGRLP